MKSRDILKRNAAAFGRECPECGEREGIESNNEQGNARSYGCHGGNGCGAQWDAVDYRDPPPDISWTGPAGDAWIASGGTKD